ncbi:unnamed protein product [Soboliphyme baturini]|uniref:EGF-like domain-containing protein n=1 Tax=Soboliphyme baturini TaxID=241478 RepID=A0A183IZ43_9BILA|nr:unnamed protein product [Soboliphyme baturini]
MPCPNDQLCTSVNAPQWSCAREPCHHVPFGVCLPITIVEYSGEEKRRFCEQAHYTDESNSMCLRFYAVLDNNLIPPGTFAAQICFNMLMVFIGNNINGLNLFCDVISRNLSYTTLIVDMVPLGDDLSLTSMQNHLINSLLNRATPFLLLQAVTSIRKTPLYLSNTVDATISAPSVEHKDRSDNGAKNRPTQEFLSIALPLVFGCMLAVTVLTIIILRQMRRYWSLINQPSLFESCTCDKMRERDQNGVSNFSSSTTYYDESNWSLDSSMDGGRNMPKPNEQNLSALNRESSGNFTSSSKAARYQQKFSLSSSNLFVKDQQNSNKENTISNNNRGYHPKMPFVTFCEKNAQQPKRTIIELEVNV